MKTAKASKSAPAPKSAPKVKEKGSKVPAPAPAISLTLGRHGRERATVETLISLSSPSPLPALAVAVNGEVVKAHGGKDSVPETALRVERTLRILSTLGLAVRTPEGFALSVQGAKVYGGKGYTGNPFPFGGKGGAILHKMRETAGGTREGLHGAGDKQGAFLTGRVVSCLVSCGLVNDTGKGSWVWTPAGESVREVK